MRLEVHVHGFIELCDGVSRRQVETALRPLLDYVDVEHIKELQSIEADQPGFAYSDRDFSLDICCTLEVGRNFFAALEKAMKGLGRLVEVATAIEIIIYHEDGRDETQLMFVGPTSAAIHDAQRRRMVEDVSALLARQFKPDAIEEVSKLINNLFYREAKEIEPSEAVAPDTEADADEAVTVQIPGVPGRHRLH